MCSFSSTLWPRSGANNKKLAPTTRQRTVGLTDSLCFGRPKLQPLLGGTGDVLSKVDGAAQLAQDVSGRIRELDATKTRLNAALSRVSDILDVKNCIDGVQLAMIDEDYEKAAGHVKRFLNIDKDVVEPASYEVLMAAEEKLFIKLQMKADECDSKDDFPGLKRFCKLISATGHPAEGLSRFIAYLRKVLSKEAEKDFDAIMQSITASQLGSPDGTGGQDDTAYVALLQRLFGVVADLFRRYEKFIIQNFFFKL